MYEHRSYPDQDKLNRILLILDLTAIMGRRILVGVARYARAQTQWSLAPDNMEAAFRLLQTTTARPLGIIAILRANAAEQMEAVRQSGLPAINVSNNTPPSGIPSVFSDDLEIGRLAATHLLDRGFRQFGYSSVGTFNFNEERFAGFEERLRAEGIEHLSRHDGSDRSKIAHWLREQPKPLAVFCASDISARHVSEACKMAGLRVPYDVAIVGVDDDELICDLADVPITSVRPNFEEIGYRAAEILDQMIQGKDVAKQIIRVQPLGVEVRRSTEVTASDDPIVAEALAIIRQRAATGMSVKELTAVLPLSRRSLERRFKKVLGRTLHDEIRARRLERARTLLLESDRSIASIARQVGYSDHRRFSIDFHGAYGNTPSRFRRGTSITT